MRGQFIAAVVLAITGYTSAQNAPEKTISVDANGADVRTVLHDLFKQAGKNFVVEPGAYYSLYLNLSNVSFDVALNTVCKTAGIDYDLENGLYRFFKPKGGKPQVTTAQTQAVTPSTTPLPPSILNTKVSVNLNLVDIRKAIQTLSLQTKVPLEVSTEVKQLRVNAVLQNTSLRYALNSITQAAKLAFSFTDRGTILIYDPTRQAASETNTQAIAAKLICEQCKTPLQKGWKYCPNCGNYVKNLTGGLMNLTGGLMNLTGGLKNVTGGLMNLTGGN